MQSAIKTARNVSARKKSEESRLRQLTVLFYFISKVRCTVLRTHEFVLLVTVKWLEIPSGGITLGCRTRTILIDRLLTMVV